MPRQSIKLVAGLNSVQSPTLNETGWVAAENIRFFQGLPQKDAGWVNLVTVSDTPLALRAWTALSGISYLGIGGSARLRVMLSGTVYDITPDTISNPSLAVSMDTTQGSPLVVIHDATDTPALNSWLQIVNPISVGGVTILGVYQVVATGVNTYTITSALNAASNASTGGAVRSFATTAGSAIVTVTQTAHNLFSGQVTNIPISLSVGGLTLMGNYLITVLTANTYSINAGSPAVTTNTASENNGNVEIIFFAPGGGTQNDIPANTVSLDNWGEFLLYATGGGPLNVWMPSQGVTTPASDVTTAPQAIGSFFVSIQVQQVICCGAINAATGLFDPMLMRWSDVGDYTSWTPLATNQAGSFRLAIGSAINAGMAVQSQNLIWTDLALYSMQYIQFPLVWGFQPLGINCGAVGPHAVGNLAGTVSWMSFNQFMTLSTNGPVMIDCPVWDQVFPNADRANLKHAVCEPDSFYGEIGWSVPQIGGTVVFARMRTDPATGNVAWTASTYHHHTAWIDQNVLGAPIGGHESGIIDQHDTGVDAGVGNPLPTSLTSGIIAISEATDVMFIRDFIPDIDWLAPGTLSLTVYSYDFPTKAPRVHGPFVFSDLGGPNVINLHARGRGIQFQLQGNDIGSNWRLGNCRYWAQPDGHR